MLVELYTAPQAKDPLQRQRCKNAIYTVRTALHKMQFRLLTPNSALPNSTKRKAYLLPTLILIL